METSLAILAFRTGKLGTWREKLGGMASFAHAAGWRLQPIDAREAAPDVAGLVEFWNARGAIVDASGEPGRFKPGDFGALPVVWMNPGDETPDERRLCVSSDSTEITRLAAVELLATSPSSLVFIEWPAPVRWSLVKRELMRKIAGMHALPMKVVTPEAAELDDPAALQSRIADALENTPHPCGVFAVTDLLGAAAISAAVRAGLAVPRDVAVASVDDDPEVCENCTPALTSVRPDFHGLGFAAGRLLKKAMDDSAVRRARAAERAEREIVAPTGLVRRASTLTLRRQDPKAAEAMELIRREACAGLRPIDAASAFGTSRRSAEMRFKAATGTTLGKAILERRLAAACDYLEAGTSSVAAIADFCGWNGDVAFRKAFKTRFGLAPLEWARRRNLRKNAPNRRRG